MTKEKLQRFSIRKLTVGAASVLIGIGFAGYSTQQVDAATTDAGQAKQEVVQEKQNTDVVESQSQTVKVDANTTNSAKADTTTQEAATDNAQVKTNDVAKNSSTAALNENNISGGQKSNYLLMKKRQ